jgi:hypothetical protein
MILTFAEQVIVIFGQKLLEFKQVKDKLNMFIDLNEVQHLQMEEKLEDNKLLLIIQHLKHQNLLPQRHMQQVLQPLFMLQHLLKVVEVQKNAVAVKLDLLVLQATLE